MHRRMSLQTSSTTDNRSNKLCEGGRLLVSDVRAEMGQLWLFQQAPSSLQQYQ